MWQDPATTAFIVAGLPSFSTLSNIVDVIKQEVATGRAVLGGLLFLTSSSSSSELQKKANEYLESGPLDVDVQADILSPAGTIEIRT